MSKVLVTNNALGPRIFNVGDKGDHHEMVMPGESKEIDLHDAKHPVVQAMLASGEIVFGKGGADKAAKGELPPARGPDLESMSEEDLKLYIKDRTGSGVPGNPNRATLIERARDAAKQS